MKVWVSRDNDIITSYVCIWVSNDGLIYSNGEWQVETGHDAYWIEGWENSCPKEFKKCFGFTPRKGTRKQYELTLTEVKE